MVPAVGIDAQAVINSQIPDDYDVYMGMLWRKFGSETPRALSGTEEEFDDAYRRFCADRDSVKIMFYFKDIGAVNGDALSCNNYDKINNFKNKLGDCGVLYSQFGDRAEFNSLLIIHLIRLILSYLPAQELMVNSEEGALKNAITAEKDSKKGEESGGYDRCRYFIKTAQGSLKEFDWCRKIVNEATVSLTNDLLKKAHSVKLASSREGGLHRVSDILEKAADEIREYTRRMDEVYPKFYGSMFSAMNNFARAFSMQEFFVAVPSGYVEVVRNSLEKYIVSGFGALGIFIRLRSETFIAGNKVPELRDANHEMGKVVDLYIEAFYRLPKLAETLLDLLRTA